MHLSGSQLLHLEEFSVILFAFKYELSIILNHFYFILWGKFWALQGKKKKKTVIGNRNCFVKLACNHHISPKRKWLPCNNQSNEFRNSLIVPALGKDLLRGLEFMKCLLHPASRAAIIQLPPQWFALILWNERTGGSAQV